MTTDFADFYAAHFQRLAVQLHAYVGDHAEAQDLTQEAFCRALDRWSRISRYEDPSSWVRRVAWNLATSRLRRRRTVARFLAQQREDVVPEPSPDRLALEAALATLPAKHRQAVVQFYLGDLTTAEIAEQQGVAEGTVRSWLSRGRGELADYFAEFASASPVPPSGVDAVLTTVRRRRRNRLATIAVLLVLAVAIPVALVLLDRGRAKDPVITPSPSPSGPVTVRIGVPGPAIGTQHQLFVLTQQLMWAYFDQAHRLFRTEDGGRQWIEVDLPEKSPTLTARVWPLDRTTFVVLAGPTIHVTEDGGTTYTDRRFSDPGKTVMRAERAWRKSGGQISAYDLRCPGEPWYGSLNGLPCELELVEVGVGPLPGLTGAKQVRTTQDGQVWLRGNDGSGEFVAYSRPSAVDKSWRRLPKPPTGSLHVSPDGQDVWILGSTGRVWRLTGNEWREWTPGLGSHDIAAIGGGSLAVVRKEAAGSFTLSVLDESGTGTVMATCADNTGLRLVGMATVAFSCGNRTSVVVGDRVTHYVPIE